MIQKVVLPEAKPVLIAWGLDWAIWHDIPHGGWCPRFRKAEDGKIPDQYKLTETPKSDYVQRTEWNVRDSDGTLIFSLSDKLSRGSAKTAFLCEKHGKPFLHVHPGPSTLPSLAAKKSSPYTAGAFSAQDPRRDLDLDPKVLFPAS